MLSALAELITQDHIEGSKKKTHQKKRAILLFSFSNRRESLSLLLLFACIKPTTCLTTTTTTTTRDVCGYTNSLLLQLCILAESEKTKKMDHFFYFIYIALALTYCLLNVFVCSLYPHKIVCTLFRIFTLRSHAQCTCYL